MQMGLWTAAIIAGGPASRFDGRDKSALPLNGRTILERQISVIRSLTDCILVVANHAARFAHTGLPVVPDIVADAGALGGIYTALSHAATEHVLVVAGDMPFLTRPFLAHLADAADSFDLVIPRSADGLQPLCARYSRRCLTPIRTRIAQRALRVQDLTAEVSTWEISPPALAAFDPDGLLFFNVNTLADYQRAAELAARLDPRESPTIVSRTLP